MEQDIYLYPGSQSEAHRLGEAALWDASFHANVSCARDIEAVIRVYGDGRSALKPEASQMVLKRWGFKRTNFVLANTIERLGPMSHPMMPITVILKWTPPWRIWTHLSVK